MTANADSLSGTTFSNAGGGLFDANTRLMMIAYRRQRLLQDVSDPAKRRNFISVAAFNEAYGQTLGEPDLQSVPPTPMPPTSLRLSTPPQRSAARWSGAACSAAC